MKHLSSLVFLLLSFSLYTFALLVDSGNRDGDMELVKVEPEALKLRKSRCGVSDEANLKETEGTGNKWPRHDITYRIVNYTPDLPSSSVDNAIQKAFGAWSEVSPLTFRRLGTGVADIMLLFASGAHSDCHPFDGPGNVLSHAFAPGVGIGGDVHFDEDELWTDRGTEGQNLFFAAAHEIGHSLGLHHSTNPGAVMYREYAKGDPRTFKLHQDDINAIQAIYGPKGGKA